jgi:hypothetical protein
MFSIGLSDKICHRHGQTSVVGEDTRIPGLRHPEPAISLAVPADMCPSPGFRPADPLRSVSANRLRGCARLNLQHESHPGGTRYRGSANHLAGPGAVSRGAVMPSA